MPIRADLCAVDLKKMFDVKQLNDNVREADEEGEYLINASKDRVKMTK